MPRHGFFARITPVSGSGNYPDNTLPDAESPTDPDYGVDSGHTPEHPIVVPPLPGVYPPPGKPTFPIYIPPVVDNGLPIYIQGTPEHPIALPPGIYPPLPDNSLPPGEKVAVLIRVYGVGSRWFVFEVPEGKVDNSLPPFAQPK